MCIKTGAGYRYGGTGFFVSVPSRSDPEETHVYLVTARHTVEKIKKLAYDAYLRINVRGGGADFLRINGEWFYPESDAVDVAVMPISSSMIGNFEIATLFVTMFASHRLIEEKEIGIGDELLIMGLFSKRQGIERNIPIVRSGIIAAMPDEPLRDDEGTGGAYEAYLAEVRSIGGLSGSPVFVVVYREEPYMSYYLLGAVRGHWDLGNDVLGPFDDDLSAVNMGIGVVTPVEEIEKILMTDVLEKHRLEIDSQRIKKNAPTPDDDYDLGF